MYPLSIALGTFGLVGVIPRAQGLGPVAVSLLTVLFAVLVAVGAAANRSAFAVGLGAVGALSSGLFADWTFFAFATLFALAYAERTRRVRGKARRVLHLSLAGLAGGSAASIAYAFRFASPTLQTVSCVVAAVLAFVPLLVKADAAVPYQLESCAKTLAPKHASVLVDEAAKHALLVSNKILDAAQFYRMVEEVSLDEAVEKGVERSWLTYVKLVETRVELEQSIRTTPSEMAKKTGTLLEEKMEEHLAVIQKAYSATAGVQAVTMGLDDTAIKAVSNANDVLEEAQKALLEVQSTMQ
ncbi:MAG: hypothetical protein KBF88_00335 [Polyangiaceae bacterium]|nr:hypothetical protein [Polyangiaceae bacterium]